MSVLLRGIEIWCLKKSEEEILNKFDRKVLRNISARINEGELRRANYNKKAHDVFKEPDITAIINTARLRWAVHVVRMEDSEIPKRIVLHKPQSMRGINR